MSELEKDVAAGTNNDVAVTPSKEIAPSEEAETPPKDDEEYIEPRMTKAKWLACISGHLLHHCFSARSNSWGHYQVNR